MPSADTRETILAAATRLISRVGPARATMRDIAAEAGVAVGLAHYHFGSRQELVDAVLERTRAQHLTTLAVERPNVHGPALVRWCLEATRELLEIDPDWHRLNAELDGVAVRDPEAAARAAAAKRAGQDYVRIYVDLIADDFGAPVLDRDALAAALVAMFDGLGLRRLVDPGFDLAAPFRAIERLILAVVAPGAEPLGTPWRTGVLRQSSTK